MSTWDDARDLFLAIRELPLYEGSTLLEKELRLARNDGIAVGLDQARRHAETLEKELP
jgi:hypothetical protein